MGSSSRYVNVFVRQENGTWEEEQKLTPADVEAHNQFGYSVDISSDTAVIGSRNGYKRGNASVYCYVYINIGEKWI